MSKLTRKTSKLILEVFTVICGLIFITPVFLVIINAFKPLGSILKNPFEIPTKWMTDNIFYVIKNMNYFKVLGNTIFISVIVVVGTVILAAMAGYKLTRMNNRKSKVITALFLSSMLVPFQTYMIPVAKLASVFHINNTIWGYIIIQIALYVPMGIFMYQGFVKNIPMSLEEAARLDGCSPFGIFAKIVFPLMRPITASIVVLYALWIWNDYALASMMLTSESNKTLTITIYSFFSAFTNRWDYALAALALSIIPITLFYVFMQKYIVSGVTAGAVKG